jgi:hypothetical protein
MRNIYKVIAVILLCFSGYAHATLIDNGAYTTDTTSGLEWLDWSLTTNMSLTDALDLNAGWRSATAAEASSLMYQLFPDLSSATYRAPGWADYDDSYQGTYDYAASLFGTSCTFCSDSGVYAQVLDYGLIGVRDVDTADIYAFNGYYPSLYSLGSYSNIAGHALVRVISNQVPEPSVLALMFAGFAGLGIVRRRRKV